MRVAAVVLLATATLVLAAACSPGTSHSAALPTTTLASGRSFDTAVPGTATATTATSTTPGCGQDPATDLRLEPHYAVVQYLHRWTKNGCPVRRDVIMSRDAYCGPANIILGFPLGPVQASATARDYDSPVAVAAVPSSAVDTGYRYNGAELWLRPGDSSALYVKRGTSVQRWPLDANPPTCQ